MPVSLALVAAALALVLAMPATSAQGEARTVAWTAPTPDRTEIRILLGSPVRLMLGAKATGPVKGLTIEPVRGLPAGATIVTDTRARDARAIFRWRPKSPGDYTLQFVARDGAGSATPIRTFVINVYRKQSYPQRYGLSNATVAHWAKVVRPATVHAGPSADARVVASLSTMTPEDTQNLVVVLNAIVKSETETWYRIRLPILPNNTTGWVNKSQLGDLTKTDTHLYVDRSKLTATLERRGVVIFRARIGVGEPHWPTPRGEFYIRSRLTNFGSAAYGPLAFGTSARSAVLTDWPGGGYVGIHGTNQPEILPGQVSHGCIRLRNQDILRLARLMKVGTPVTIR